MNLNNGVGLHSNYFCLILRICFCVYVVMDKTFPSLLISRISYLSIFDNYILKSEEFLLFPWVIEPLWSFISGPSSIRLMCLPLLYIFLHILRPLFVLVIFLLSWAHALPTLLSAWNRNLFNDEIITVKQLCCTVYLYACNGRF